MVTVTGTDTPVIEMTEHKVDFHCHILPGVDDGVRTLEETLAILKEYESLGLADVWCTPHIMEDCGNTTEGLKERFNQLLDAYDGTVRLHLGAEYMMDNLFLERLETGDLLTVDGKVLVETSYFCPPANLDSILDKIKSKGYFPILAHPERYMYMSKEDYRKYKASGIYFQMNLGSLKGYYGRHVKKKAKWLKRKGYYDYTGSDLHGRNMIRNIFTD